MTQNQNEKNNCIDIVIPIKTYSEMNRRDHYMARAARFKRQKTAVSWMLNPLVSQISLPCTVTITRISKRFLDEDNLYSSLKAVVDQVCDCLIPGLKPGRADGSDQITLIYKQEKGKDYAVRLQIN